MTRRSLAPLALLALLAGACSDFATEPDRSPAALRLSPDTIVLNEGETVAFDLTVLDQDGEAYSALPSWAVPAYTVNESARLNVSPAGVAEAVSAGEVRATVELAGLTAQSVVRVNPLTLTVAVDFVYITQSVQRKGGGVPLVAGRSGLLRVYLRSGGPNFFQPSVRATFYRNGSEVHTVMMHAEAVGIPELVEEGDLQLSYDATIPGSVLQPGTSLVIEADPDGVVPTTPSSTLRMPETGELALNIRTVLPFRVRLVPVNPAVGQPSSFNDGNARDRIQMTDDVFPLNELDVDVRAPYETEADLSTSDGWYQLIQEIATLRMDDNSPRYYFGGFRRPSGTNLLGLGFVGYPVAIGEDRLAGTIAHEIGHNLNLPHAPCGSPAGVDPNYPYPAASIGRYGWDRTHEVLYSPEDTYDLMSYCDPDWISDYNYERVLAYRDTSEYDAVFDTAAAVAAPEPVLIVQGGVRGGALRLAPVLESTAPASPSEGGPYTLEGLDAVGAVLFTLAVSPRPLDHTGSTLFTVAIPRDLAQPDRLATLRLTGPEGVAERGGGTAPPGRPRVRELAGSRVPGRGPAVAFDAGLYPLAVARDRGTGQIVAMSRTGRLRLPGDPSGFDVELSDGLRTHRAEVQR